MSSLMKKRSGVSLLEVLISIGVIALGIFGVATLIPVAQLKVAEGTSLDRQAALGPSAVAEFRIRGMNSPATWVGPAFTDVEIAKGLPSRAVVIDPLGYFGNVPVQQYYPAASASNWRLPRFTINSIPNLSIAQRVFYLQDDWDFDRPEDQSQQPRPKYFIDSSSGKPLALAPTASLTWFATLSPSTAVTNFAADEFLLSIAICEGRVPELATQVTAAAEAEHEFDATGGSFPGDLWVRNVPFANEIEIGDWVLVGKRGTNTAVPNPPVSMVPGPATDMQAKTVYRWVKIIGKAEEPGNDPFRWQFVISNDDFLLPTQTARVFFVKGVRSVFERTIRLENTTSAGWN